MPDSDPSTVVALKALANPNRLMIVEWLADPCAHFPPQVDGDLVEDGVCLANIVNRLGLAQPTVTSHMRALADAGLVTSKPVKNWVFYKLDQVAVAAVLESLASRAGINYRAE